MSRSGAISRDKSGSDNASVSQRLGRGLTLAGFLISTAAAIACAVICLLSSVPLPPVPVVIWGSLFVGLFPLNLHTVLSRQDGQSQWTVNLWIKLALALFVVCFVSGFMQLGHGQPEIIHGAYYQDNHGTLTRVSYGTYLWAARAAARMFSGGACLFYVVAAERYAERWRDD